MTIKPATRQCSVSDCTEASVARGYCQSHYYFLHYRTLHPLKGRKVRPLKRLELFGRACIAVALTRGLESIIDVRDEQIAAAHNWHAMPGDNTFYAVRRENKKIIYLHREIMNCPPDKEVDHRSRDGLDNRRGNLRLATHSLNGVNRALPMGKTSRFRGVSIYRPRNVWQAQLKANGHNTGLGHFKVEEDAARAYDAAAFVAFGDFAILNFPRGAQ